MSIPRDILDQLLSGYLDDVLSNDEQSRIEQLLRDEPEVASEMEDLRRIRGNLRQISRADANVRLDDGFADRVIQAAVAQATTEGLSEDHPLLRVAGHPNTPSRAHSLPIGKIAAALVALAASITIGIVMLQQPGQPQPLDIADGEFASADFASVDRSPAMTDSDKTDPDGVVQPNVAGDGLIAAVDVESVADTVSDALSPADVMDTADAPSETAIAKAVEKPASTTGNVLPARRTEAEAAALLGESNVLTILVKRTEAGRQSRAVRKAMIDAAIDSAEEMALTEAMVSAVAGSIKDEAKSSAGTQLIFLEVPAKKIDVFFARLMSDEQGIQSVGLGLVATPSVRRFVKSLRPEAVRAIRHSQSWQLQGDGVDRVADALVSGQSFLPMQSVRGLPLTAPSDGDGPDVLSRVLILIQ